MPWEKKFDMEEAVDKAITIFKKKGYEATSLNDLTDGMGINKGSLYNAFGSKKALFDQALLRYDEKNRRQALSDLSQLSDGREAIIKLFDRFIAETEADISQCGCLLVNTALELPIHGDDVQKMVKTAFNEFELFLVGTIKKGQAFGSIPITINPERCAKSLLSLFIGLRVLARGAYESADLKAICDHAITMISKPV